MAIITLTEKHHVNPDVVGMAIFDVKYGLPHFELRYCNEAWESTDLYEGEAEQAWANWTAFVNGASIEVQREEQ